MKTVFILSTGRTGTKFMADYFAALGEDILAYHEPVPSRRFRILSNMYTAGKVNEEILIRIFKFTRHKIIANPSLAKYYIESNNFLYGYCDLLPKVFEDCHIIHIIRDPRDYITSHINHGVFRGAKLLAKNYFPYWFMNVPKRLGKSAMKPWEILAGRWLIVNQFLENRGKNLQNYHFCKFENVFRQDLEQICKQIDLPYNEQILENLKKTKVNEGKLAIFPKWTSWTVEQMQEVDAICGPYMRTFGYGKEDNWASVPMMN